MTIKTILHDLENELLGNGLYWYHNRTRNRLSIMDASDDLKQYLKRNIDSDHKYVDSGDVFVIHVS